MQSHTHAVVKRILAGITLVGVSALVLATAIATSEPGDPASAEIIDDETVYVLMDSDGTHRETVVIDWLQVTGDGAFDVTDHGVVTGVEALKDDIEAAVTGQDVTWALDVDGRRDFFYRAETELPLPLEVEAVYTLDGFEVEPDALAGRSGHLRVDVTVRNLVPLTESVSYVDADGTDVAEDQEFWLPLLAPVQISLDGTRFRNIEEEADILSVTGTTMAYTFMTFPQDEQTISIEMDGEDIRLDPIIVSAFPTMPGSTSFDFTEDFADMREGTLGLAQLSRGHAEILSGVIAGFEEFDTSALAASAGQFDQLGAAISQLSAGADGLSMLMEGQLQYLDGLIAGIDPSQFEDAEQLASVLETLTAGVEQSRDGVAGMVALLDGQIAFLDGIAASNAGLSTLAATEAAATGDATMTTLATGLASQDVMIAALRDGDAAYGLDMGLSDTRDTLQAIANGLGATASALDTITAEVHGLSAALPSAFAEIRSSLRVLRDGGAIVVPTPDGPMESVLPGLTESLTGLQGLADGLGQMETGFAASTEDLALLETLPAQLGDLTDVLTTLRDGGFVEGNHVPGVTTTASGLEEMSAGLAEGVDGGRMGAALTAHMESAAAAYDTFLGKPEGAAGRVRFVMKLDGIGQNE